MNIGINTLFLVPNKVGGTEYYTRSFLKYLEKLDKENNYTVFCNRENYDSFEFKSDKWKKVICPVRGQNKIARILYEQLALPFQVFKERCNVLHSYGYFGPVFTHSKRIVTVHDANWKDHPDDVSPFEVFVLNILISLNIFSSHKIVTDSDFSKGRLIHWYPGIKNRIEVVPGAVDDDFLEELKKDSPPFVKGNYLLCVSAFYPHKRIPYLVDLFKEISIKDKEIKLVLVGRNGKEEQKVLDMIRGNERIIHFPKVKFIDLVNLYKNAKAFIFPSVYEGFGYPVYEALAAGTPTYVGNTDLYDTNIRKMINNVSSFDNKQIKRISSSSTNYNCSVLKLLGIYK